MLHTDLALLLAKKARQPDAGAHIAAATALLRAAVDRSSGQAEFARRWRGTVAGLLQAFGAAEIAYIFIAGRADELAALFSTIVRQFRSRYVLTYRPQGVGATGWHTLDLRLKSGRATISARRGYAK